MAAASPSAKKSAHWLSSLPFTRTSSTSPNCCLLISICGADNLPRGFDKLLRQLHVQLPCAVKVDDQTGLRIPFNGNVAGVLAPHHSNSQQARCVSRIVEVASQR